MEQRDQSPALEMISHGPGCTKKVTLKAEL